MSHTSALTHEFLAKDNMAVIPHPPYSPDLAPRDFFLFLKKKLKLTLRQFDIAEEIQSESHRLLDTASNGIPGSIPKMDETVDPCLHAGGNYFEGESGRYAFW
jgi:hypothetical protein